MSMEDELELKFYDVGHFGDLYKEDDKVIEDDSLIIEDDDES